MRKRERQEWMELVRAEQEAHRKERQELLNRIAAPEKRIVDVVAREPRPAPTEDKELAFVGGVVPDGVTVGHVGDADGQS